MYIPVGRLGGRVRSDELLWGSVSETATQYTST